ncbi:glycoside hydrolase family 6 protein [Nocardioides acrostichi]|uniref:Glucanase n=1 Tax=Nocardioides acrostichi TaxID=2784339 RepID=A0A930V2Y5_9ACTN|nr:glycoside hydrolase family 6 protein [Nocardioides acrostichi]MBF4162916.1 glycoside hydrolase family 6 protein [Nocardioides acrostichi]
MPLPPVRLRRRLLMVTCVVLFCAAPLLGCSDDTGSDDGGSGATDSGTSDAAARSGAPLEGNPWTGEEQYVLPSPRLDAAAQQASADGDAQASDILRRIAAVPSGIWLTPERYPSGQVGPFVASVVAAAGNEVPLFVVYGVPDRDCTGAQSTGGLTDDTYLPWVSEIAGAAGDHSVVVLEPDALASAGSCGGDQRLPLLGEAVGVLADDGVATYIDAGHSSWIDSATIAQRLAEVGVERVRGFATNVANYQPMSAELDYARAVASQVGGTHFVIDTGRDGDPDGAGDPVTEWCNPSGQSLGRAPGVVDDQTGLDALLWVKPPAESDGTCNGGPAAGEVWVARAVELGRSAGW